MIQTEADLLISRIVAKIEPLMKQQKISYWDACISGKDEDYERYTALRLQIQKVFSNPEDFDALKRIKASEGRVDAATGRQVHLLHNAFLPNQIDPELNRKITALSTDMEKTFNTFRGRMGEKEVSGNDIMDILGESTDPEQRRLAWEAAKAVGPVVEKDLLRLVKMRNRAARSLGFENYFSMRLVLAEQDEAELVSLFERLKKLTDDPFRQAKEEIDGVLAARYGIKPEHIKPWHYQDPFFQESPKVFSVDLDVNYRDRDIKALSVDYYRGLGMDVLDILERSDLYEKTGKYPHAFCTNIDRKGDVRVMLNLKNNEYWMDTILHELGHAVYAKYHDPAQPFLLRESAHTLTTEAIALLFGRFAHSPQWLYEMKLISLKDRDEMAPVLRRAQRYSQLIFARWCMVMFYFERALYKEPYQDLNALWWHLVDKYQGIKGPGKRDRPDWATKIHLTSSPVYYHNYLLGELLASQLYYHIQDKILEETGEAFSAFTDRPVVGDYLRASIFFRGARYPWNDLIARATGEKLNPRYFVRQFVAPADKEPAG